LTDILYSIVIPVFKNEASLTELLSALERVDLALDHQLELVFVVDASPDRSFEILRDALKTVSFRSQLLLLSRNFGSFPAARAGLAAARGTYFMIMAADLQDPPDFAVTLLREVALGDCDVALGTRNSRNDTFFAKMNSRLFWFFYKKWIVRDLPHGGVDLFACNKVFRDQLLALKESNTSLVGLIFWVGFRRKFIPYDRLPRPYGESAWTFRKKTRYLADSVFSFTDLPIRLLTTLGLLGLAVSLTFGIFVSVARLSGFIPVPGYSATVLTILFFAGLNSFGLGLLGSYVWRTYENTKSRPESIVMRHEKFTN
jgi:glycosyltransferase involved in cell wall biosynthesis